MGTNSNRKGSTNTLTTGEISATNVKTSGLRLTTTNAPSSASDTGTTGQIRYDSNYIYVCVATNMEKGCNKHLVI